MSTFGFTTLTNAVTVENNIDDSLAEIDMMVKRLYKIRKQLTKQKKYTSLAKDLFIKEAFNATIPINTSAPTIDARIVKFKHDGYLYLNTDISTPPDVSYNLGPTDTSFNIFTDDNDVDSSNDGTGYSLNILQIKRFLTAVNSVLTQPNNITSTALDASGAYYWNDDDADGNIDHSEIVQDPNYKAGQKHKITSAFTYLITMGSFSAPPSMVGWSPELIPGFGLAD